MLLPLSLQHVTRESLWAATASLAMLGGCTNTIRVGGSVRVSGAGEGGAVGVVVSLGCALAESGIAPNVLGTSGLWESIVYAGEVSEARSERACVVGAVLCAGSDCHDVRECVERHCDSPSLSGNV